MRKSICLVGFIVLITLTPESVEGNEVWSPVVIARGEYRSQIKALPIEHRPNRPLHFYGNYVRRNVMAGPVSVSQAQWNDVQSMNYVQPTAGFGFSRPAPRSHSSPEVYSGGSISTSGFFSRPQGVVRTRFLRY
jgi:hypothetical protein